MDFLLEENALLRQTIRNIIVKIHNAGATNALTPYDKGWDAAITETLNIIEIESGVTINEILEAKCN